MRTLRTAHGPGGAFARPSLDAPFDPSAPAPVWQLAFAIALGTFAASLAWLVLAIALQFDEPPAAVAEDLGERGGSSATGALTASGGTEPGALAPVPPIQSDAALSSVVTRVLDGDTEGFGIVVRRLSDGRGLAINGDEQFYAASLFKLALFYEAFRQREAGDLDFAAELTFSGEDLAEDLGTLGDLDAGEDGILSVGEAVRAMVVRSDNASAVAMLHLLGGERVDQTLRQLGLQTMSVNTSGLPTTAADMALLAEAVYTGRGLTPAAATEMRAMLRDQLTRDGIPAGLPRGVPAGNKTGNWPGSTHDVAFVEAPRGTYIIAILSRGDWAWGPIREVSQAVYTQMEKR